MTKTEALAEARRRWGKDAHVRFNRGAFREKDRAMANADLKLHRAAKPVRPIPSTLEYVKAFREWKAEEDRLFAIVLRSPCDVGAITNLGNVFVAFHWGSGDTWEAAFAKADAR